MFVLLPLAALRAPRMRPPLAPVPADPSLPPGASGSQFWDGCELGHTGGGLWLAADQGAKSLQGIHLGWHRRRGRQLLLRRCRLLLMCRLWLLNSAPRWLVFFGWCCRVGRGCLGLESGRGCVQRAHPLCRRHMRGGWIGSLGASLRCISSSSRMLRAFFRLSSPSATCWTRHFTANTSFPWAVVALVGPASPVRASWEGATSWPPSSRACSPRQWP